MQWWQIALLTPVAIGLLIEIFQQHGAFDPCLYK